MGRGRKSFLAFFRFKKIHYGGEEEPEPTRPRPRKIQPSDDDSNYSHWYAEPDIDRKAKEYIEKVRSAMHPERPNKAD